MRSNRRNENRGKENFGRRRFLIHNDGTMSNVKGYRTLLCWSTRIHTPLTISQSLAMAAIQMDITRRHKKHSPKKRERKIVLTLPELELRPSYCSGNASLLTAKISQTQLRRSSSMQSSDHSHNGKFLITSTPHVLSTPVTTTVYHLSANFTAKLRT